MLLPVVAALLGVGVASLVERPQRGLMGPVTAFFIGGFMAAVTAVVLVQSSAKLAHLL